MHLLIRSASFVASLVVAGAFSAPALAGPPATSPPASKPPVPVGVISSGTIGAAPKPETLLTITATVDIENVPVGTSYYVECFGPAQRNADGAVVSLPSGKSTLVSLQNPPAQKSSPVVYTKMTTTVVVTGIRGAKEDPTGSCLIASQGLNTGSVTATPKVSFDWPLHATTIALPRPLGLNGPKP